MPPPLPPALLSPEPPPFPLFSLFPPGSLFPLFPLSSPAACPLFALGPAFGGALGFRILVPMTDYISFITGYEALLLTNIALGPDQHQGVGTNLLGATQYHVVTHGLFVAHGGNAGLQVTW